MRHDQKTRMATKLQPGGHSIACELAFSVVGESSARLAFQDSTSDKSSIVRLQPAKARSAAYMAE